MKEKLQTQPYRGARDFYPEDMRTQNYIYDTWKRVCVRYGFEQYDFPVLEPFDIFAAKSGEELVNEQLFVFEDKAGRKLAIRPELTPGTVRMLAQKYKEIPQPIKWFMIGNNWRYEKPQMGRGREFNQLEVNIFGVRDITADCEIFEIIIALMNEFGADRNMYVISINDRRLVSCLLDDLLKLDEPTQIKVRRLMDKKAKISQEEFAQKLQLLGLNAEQITRIEKYLSSSLETLPQVIPQTILENNPGYKDIMRLFEMLNERQLAQYCRFDPTIIRGFDYSDGLVYEVFDQDPNNKRSLFGGERFDRLINIFGNYDLPATGFAMGDYTLLEFLKGWNLIPDFTPEVDYFVTVWPSENPQFWTKSLELADKIRGKGQSCYTWPETDTKLDKQLKYADKKGYKYAIILGEEELKSETITVKNMSEGSQETKPWEKFLNDIE
jgi:histidyl-tRNA synthetase